MHYLLNREVQASLIASNLGAELVGTDVDVGRASNLSVAGPGSIVFCNGPYKGGARNCLIITTENVCTGNGDCNGYIVGPNPRLTFIKALGWLERNCGFSTWNFDSEIHPTVKIGNNVVIEPGCKIGAGCVIEHNVVIHAGTRVGVNSRIRSCSSIGGDGFGFERDEDGDPIRFPHLGGVVIGNDVEIGALNSIARGTLADTVIGDSVKTDNLVHVAHNCRIGPQCLITACAELSGGVELSESVWVGPNSSFLQKVHVGAGAIIGLGAVITKDVAPNSVVAGNPAKKIRTL